MSWLQRRHLVFEALKLDEASKLGFVGPLKPHDQVDRGWVNFALVTRLSVVDATSFSAQARGHSSTKWRAPGTMKLQSYVFVDKIF